MKFVVAVKNQSDLSRMMKSAILSICQNIFKKYHKHFGQFGNILPGCYLLDTVYDSVTKWIF